MILTQYRSGKPLVLLGFWWAKKTWRGTKVNYGRTFRVRETPEEIERLDILGDKARES